MEENKEKINHAIDLKHLQQLLLSKKRTFLIAWVVTVVLSFLWVFPQPRFYTCEVALAPEAVSEDAGGLASVASSFGFNLGNNSADAIYPLLYPDLMDTNEFIVEMLGTKIKTSDGSVSTDYYTYLTKHQKENWLTKPFSAAMQGIKNIFISEDSAKTVSTRKLNAFMLSQKENDVVESVRNSMTCIVDKKTDVVSIAVDDQDPVVCAQLANAACELLQKFIVDYRTKKTRVDVEHYQHLVDSTNLEYRSAVNAYAMYCDANQDILLQNHISKRDELENDMQMKYNTYTAMCTHLETTKAKLQEKTPAFTILRNATVPLKPAGPKRMRFVLGMLILVTFVMFGWYTRKELKKLFV